MRSISRGGVGADSCFVVIWPECAGQGQTVLKRLMLDCMMGMIVKYTRIKKHVMVMESSEVKSSCSFLFCHCFEIT